MKAISRRHALADMRVFRAGYIKLQEDLQLHLSQSTGEKLVRL